MRTFARRLSSLSAAVVVATALASAPATAEAPGDGPAFTVLSSRPQVVSAGNALVRLDIPDDLSAKKVRVKRGGTDVTASFRAVDRGRALEGLVTDLRTGRNVLTATARGVRAARIVLDSHPVTGPVFSGPHEQPFVCDTEAFTTVTGDKLGPPADENCSITTRVDQVYRTTAGKFAPLPADQARPADLAWTTTSAGRRVPYIVRVETGTVNRAVYEMSMLADPEAGEPDPWRRSPGWNGRLIYTFGGGCSGGWYIQGRNTGSVMDDRMLRQGYAVASSSLNVFGNNCNDLLAGETMSMVKERFIEAYGAPRFTIGWGCSGGSYQTHQIGDNYPGLLDGIVSGCSFPEVGFATVNTITDARLLDHYFREVAPGAFSQEQQQAVSGFGRWESIANLAGGGGRIDPRIFCPDQLPESSRYHPDNNPAGARCDVYDHTVNVYGRDPQTGFARRPLDNTGIQYGLGALRDKAITVEQFLDLNEGIGGFDADANHVPERTEADLAATRAAYRSGRLLNAGAGLARMPMIDYRAYTDDAAGGDIHMRFHSFSTRERLRKANGTHANQVMIVEDNRYGGFSLNSPVLLDALTQMDRWLTAIGADHRPGRPLDKVVRNKPRELTDACWTRDPEPREITERQVAGNGTTACNTLYPVWTSPRLVAGGPMAGDVVKCRLRPVDPAEYGTPLTELQLDRLRKLFPGGVCDWDARGIEQQGLAGTWQSFG
ncbi:hypothetical protein FE391_12285 [Nonomuraea sp. KC401]|uniref:DUF6351 family protein n=1 Tax=unclassified Nonomuraea TaxID=2593643 RepID=UPI0010FF353E|nr:MULTISPECIES: DUF6351 family protein [unclassified Nonomuraea]NBE95923.1 hypothetical protein [Nonomuraea sp. K271]TLF76276.1 hypothetical protein FE391_12285 [Nonomuraea sp. KC401]